MGLCVLPDIFVEAPSAGVTEVAGSAMVVGAGVTVIAGSVMMVGAGVTVIADSDVFETAALRWACASSQLPKP